MDPDEIAITVVSSFTGDEFTDWIDTEAATAVVSDAIRAAVAAQRERDAQFIDFKVAWLRETYVDEISKLVAPFLEGIAIAFRSQSEQRVDERL